MTGNRGFLMERISHDPKNTEDGVERQHADNLALCARMGIVVVETFRDNDRSAYRIEDVVRERFEDMLIAVASGGCDWVVATRHDRIHVRTRDRLRFLEALRAGGAKVVTDKEGVTDPESATGRMLMDILGSVAEGERALNSERRQRAELERARQGRVKRTRRAFGYDDDGVTIRVDEAALIREAVTRLKAGDSLNAICHDWNARNIRTTRGNAWLRSPLRAMLRNPRYAGMRVYKGDVMGAGEWPAIIDADDHATILRITNEHASRTNGDGTVRAARRYLLSGLLRCESCGEPMSGYRRAEYGTSRYRCTPPPTGRGCGKTSIAQHHADEWIVDHVLTMLAESTELPRALDVANGKADEDVLDLIASLTQNADETYAEWKSGDISKNRYEMTMRRIDAKLDVLRASVASDKRASVLAQVVGKDRATLDAEWLDYSPDLKRSIIRAAIGVTPIAKSRGGRMKGGGYFDEYRILIPRTTRARATA